MGDSPESAAASSTSEPPVWRGADLWRRSFNSMELPADPASRSPSTPPPANASRIPA